MKSLFCIPLLVLALPSCVVVIGDVDDNGSHSSRGWFDSEEPSIAATRTVEDFHALEMCDSSDVHVVIGATRSVVVHAPTAVESFVRTEVKDGVLTISRAEGAPRSRRGVRVDVVVPALDAVTVRGSGDVRVEGLASKSLRIESNGTGDVRIAGTAEDLDIAINGTGDAQLFDLAARKARVRIAGTGDVSVQPGEALDVEILGTGDVRYRGAPRITQQVRGTGDVRRD